MNGINVKLRSLRTAFNWAKLDNHEKGKVSYIDDNPFATKDGESPLFDVVECLPRYLEGAEIDAMNDTIKRRIEIAKQRIAILEADMASKEEVGKRISRAEKWEIKILKERIGINEDLHDTLNFLLYSGVRRSVFRPSNPIPILGVLFPHKRYQF